MRCSLVRYEYAVVEQGFDQAGGDQRFRVRVAQTRFNCCINVGLAPPAPKEADAPAPKLSSKVKQLAEKYLPIARFDAQPKRVAPSAVAEPSSVQARMARCVFTLQTKHVESSARFPELLAFVVGSTGRESSWIPCKSLISVLVVLIFIPQQYRLYIYSHQ